MSSIVKDLFFKMAKEGKKAAKRMAPTARDYTLNLGTFFKLLKIDFFFFGILYIIYWLSQPPPFCWYQPPQHYRRQELAYHHRRPCHLQRLRDQA